MSEMVHPRAGPSSCLEDGAKDEKADLSPGRLIRRLCYNDKLCLEMSGGVYSVSLKSTVHIQG